MTYISVPYQQWEPVGESPLKATTLSKAPYPEGEGVGGGASLVQYQEHNFHKPSEIAKDSLLTLLSQPKEDKRHRYDQLCTDFVDYLCKCEEKGFMVKGYDTIKGKILNLPMSYNNRWGPVRRKELSEKLERLEFWFEQQEDRPVTLATLTSYHPDTESVADSWFKLNEARGKFLKMIKKYCGKDTDYFWVPEPHPETDNGYVHYHVAIFADIPIPLENKLRRLWADKYKVGSHTYGLDFAKKENKEKINHLKAYLSKYLEKGFLLKEWSIGLLIFNATLWDTGFRMYGASTAIRKMMNIKDDKDSKVVWLETRLETIELTADNEEVAVSEIVWDRLYILDWIDHSLWTREPDMLDWQWWDRLRDPDMWELEWWYPKEARRIQNSSVPRRDNPLDKIFRCNWGRPYKGMRIYEQNVAKLPREARMSTQEQERRRIQKETEEQYSEVKEVQLTERQKRKLEQDGYL